MRTLLLVLCVLTACKDDKPKAPDKAGSEPAPAAKPETPPPPAPDAAAAAPPKTEPAAPDAAAASTGGFCCCSSFGDVGHMTIEKDEAYCKGELRGECVEPNECDLAGTPKLLVADQPMTLYMDEKGILVAIWKPAKGKLVAIEVKPKNTTTATVRARPEERWANIGKVTIDAARGGTIALTAQTDGTLSLVTTIHGHGSEGDEVATWTLSRKDEYDKIVMKRKK